MNSLDKYPANRRTIAGLLLIFPFILLPGQALRIGVLKLQAWSVIDVCISYDDTNDALVFRCIN
jgi:hypothetical protein